ncbi:hypothetical protein R6242_16290 [Iodobacter sp. CM08]|uniref:hypothetical protein n=1 Tax=Iodobacter sp. CM08 TaxID=3085902 RepID=UPI0029815047|nr:hypothetical protein [Iodobacter sp. CM08]MDW5418127.1 hypothetical protein [Iodobacter sp. CM08]
MTKNHLVTHYKLKRPCKNCPFLKMGAIDLMPGRLQSIIENLVNDDYSTFQCHKTVHDKRSGGSWNEEGEYKASRQESMCAGAMIYLEKVGRPTVGMRVAKVFGIYNVESLSSSFNDVIDPE